MTARAGTQTVGRKSQLLITISAFIIGQRKGICQWHTYVFGVMETVMPEN